MGVKPWVKGTEQLNKVIDNLYDLESDLSDDIEELTAEDAAYIAQTLDVNYHNFVSSYYDGRNKKNEGKITVYPNKKGYTINIRGKDVLYQEFGTGDIGKKSGYPDKRLMRSYGYEYNKGPNVIPAGSADDLLSYGELPLWYINFVHKKPGRGRKNWWMSPGGISNGIPAGMFLYDTFMAYVDDDADNTSQSATIEGGGGVMKKALSKQTIGAKVIKNVMKDVRK